MFQTVLMILVETIEVVLDNACGNMHRKTFCTEKIIRIAKLVLHFIFAEPAKISQQQIS